MKFRFSHFEFDCEALVLTNNGKVFSLNEKPAKLLALLLTNAEHIHSKDEILEAVWPGREVTNQVVFQSIGHLRALFGDDAIKTFSRKGYQWQLPLTEVTDDEAPPATSPQVETPKQTANNDNNEDLSIPSAPEDNIATDTPKPAWPLAAATLLGLLAGAYFFI
ncbi:winged helix-turn-helix domain-containing protein [Pseudoalteromonas sp. MMG022]|uniref:winged helix-turn-helix domain-containing protein n=1 Tax=Pseudoalteromonas sp. MMG022 TaxID=2909978 RepID=UPI001EFFA623|nr:winged helix-turn-helix domain-containing protein [Pseudoalteromonas sp. MMG022]MCF6436899.1 winged helix-turn-helix domain-containing protein [Pseudoalteromonas sp. MMG022]